MHDAHLLVRERVAVTTVCNARVVASRGRALAKLMLHDALLGQRDGLLLLQVFLAPALPSVTPLLARLAHDQQLAHENSGRRIKLCAIAEQ